MEGSGYETFVNYACPIPSVSSITISEDDKESFISIEIIDEVSWQTLASIQVPLLTPLPTEMTIANYNCDQLTLKEDTSNLTCFLTNGDDKQADLARLTDNSFSIASETVRAYLSEMSSIKCGYSSNGF